MNDNRAGMVNREKFSAEIMIHLDHLYRVAVHLARNDDEAQDCVQETCARALSAQHQFAPGTNLKAWLTRILYNFFYDSYAHRKRLVLAEELAAPGEHKEDYWDGLASDDASPEEEFLGRELGGKIKEALSRIPEEFRAPIVLVDMGDLTYAQVAGILSCPIGTIRSRLSRGRKLLHELLGDYVRMPEESRPKAGSGEKL